MRWHFRIAFFLLILKFVFFLNTPVFSKGPSFVVTLPKGASAKSLYNIVDRTNRLNSKLFFYLLIKLSPEAKHLQAGTYELTDILTPLSFITMLSEGQVLTKVFTIIPGTTIEDVVETIKHKPYIKTGKNILKELKKKHQLKSLEGRLLPDSYEYHAYTPASSLLESSLNKMTVELENIWKNRNKDLPFKTPLELLTAASIVEKETHIEREKALVAAVINNRLKKNMRLQMDPTIIYALGDAYDGSLHKKNLKIKSPYNTYLYKGLPPTPIAFPSISSLNACAHPAEVPYLYFVANEKGAHTFSVTLKDQRQAVKAYIRYKRRQ